MGPHQSEREVHSFGTARRAQARAGLSTGARLTVVFLTFSVLAQGGGGYHFVHLSLGLHRCCR